MPQPHILAARTVQTERLRLHLLETGPEDGVPVLFLHGNASSSYFWKDALATLPSGFRGLAVDLRGYGRSEPASIDATRGLRDFSDDVAALLRTLGLAKANGRLGVVGWSMGAGVALQLALDNPGLVGAIVLEAPVPPFGFGGTKDLQGTPCWPDYAGSGGGVANPEYVQRLKAQDRSSDSPVSPRNVMNAFYFKPPFRSPDEEELLSAILQMQVREDQYPGDIVPSANWPGVAPGTRGINNAFSPKYLNLSAFAELKPQPDVLWIRGAEDQIISDASPLDLGTLGKLGLFPGWPGDAVYPPQPMVGQTRALLERYRRNGGRYREEVLPDCGHSPHLERPADFHRLLHGFLADCLATR
jgi:pimeloyl-ACP methyl ester carboxylesterase